VAVKYLFLANSPSNKSQKYCVNLSATGYWYDTKSGYKVTVCKPKVDRLTLTYDIPDPELQLAVCQYLWDNAADSNYPNIQNAKTKLKKIHGAPNYGTSVQFVPPGEVGSVFIQAKMGGVAPKSGKLMNNPKEQAFLRFDFNPARLGPTGLSLFKDELNNILHDTQNTSWAELATKAKITRLDIAVDLINVDIEDMMFRFAKAGGKSGSYFGVGSKLETRYLNVTSGGSNTYVYDRRQRLLDLQNDGKGSGPEYGETPHTRIEFRTDSTRPVVDLPNLLNHLKKIEVFDIDALSPPEEAHHWRLFQDSCRYRGLSGALELLPEGLRQEYEDTVKTVESELWRPDKLWEKWPESLEASGLLDLGK
jgi:hypothetical protein